MPGQFPLRKAGYEAKERIREVRRSESMPADQKACDRWDAKLPEEVRRAFSDLTTAMHNWRLEVLTYFDTRVTNAYTESFNSRAKTVNRLGPGYAFEVPRAKLLQTRSCQKMDRATYERPPEALSIGRMTTSFMLQEDAPPRSLGVGISTLATELGKLSNKPLINHLNRSLLLIICLRIPSIRS